MREQEDTPIFHRRVRVVLYFVLAVAVLWMVVWFIFFRPSPAKSTDVHTVDTSGNQSSGSANATTKRSSSNSSEGSTASQATPGNATTASGAPASQLANTGAGDVFIPFGAAVVIGSVVYQIWVRRKYAQ